MLEQCIHYSPQLILGAMIVPTITGVLPVAQDGTLTKTEKTWMRILVAIAAIYVLPPSVRTNLS